MALNFLASVVIGLLVSLMFRVEVPEQWLAVPVSVCVFILITAIRRKHE